MPHPTRIVQIRLNQHAVTRHIRKEVGSFARIVLNVIETDLHRSILEYHLVAHGLNLKWLRITRERIFDNRMLASGKFLEQFDVGTVGDDLETLGDRYAQAARMIKMMVRHNDVRQGFL